MEIERKLELEVDPKDVTESHSHNKTLRMRICFLRMNKERGLLRWNLFLVKRLWRLFKWQDYDNLSWYSSRRVWEDWGQFWQKSCGNNAVKQHHMPRRNCFWREEAINAANFIVLFYEIATATPIFSNHHSDPSTSRQELQSRQLQ